MIKTNKVLIAFFLSAVIFSFDVNKSISQVTDIDGNVYKTVVIGNQEWMAENLNVAHYRNGDAIYTLKEMNEKSAWESGCWCYYDNDVKNGKTYGRLYDWYAVNDKSGLAPEGWHIPSDAEWKQLIDYLGGEKTAGSKLKATEIWKSPNIGATNGSGFSALPGGFLSYRQTFFSLTESSFFWSSTVSNNNKELLAWCRYLDYDKSDVIREESYKSAGLSIRCVKD